MNLGKPMSETALAATLFVAVACGGSAGVATPRVPSGPSSSSSSVVPTQARANTPPAAPTTAATAPATPSATADLSAVQACTLLDQQTLEEITGQSGGFSLDGPPVGTFCSHYPFSPGAKSAVDISVFPSDGLSDYTYRAGHCSSDPVTLPGTEAKGGTCPDSHPYQVYIAASDNGVGVLLAVSSPKRPLEPEDMGPTAQKILLQLAPD